MTVGVTPRVARAAIAYARGDRVKNTPPSLRLWSMLKRQPALLGGRSILDEHGQLWAEFEEYAHAESEVAAEREALANARRRRHARG